MMIKRLALQQLSLTSTVVLTIFSFILAPTAGYSQSSNKSNNSEQKTQTPSNKLPRLPENGAPTGRREGGASRNGCPILNTNLTAIVPGAKEMEKESSSKSFLATTISEHPTFWVYIPNLPQKSPLGEFIIQNEAGEDIYRKSLTLPKNGGIVGVKAPSATQYALAVDQKYHWYFRVFCDRSKTQPEYIYVDSWIQRVSFSPTVDTQLKTDKPENYLDYVDRDIWYDALTNLASLRNREPQNKAYKNDWTSLLEILDLENLAQEAIVWPR
jgi:hypothetical protein